MLLQDLAKRNLISPPKWLPDNTHYMTVMGSEAYAVPKDTGSDIDYYGFCIPPKELVFPEKYGNQITGFGKQIQRFTNWQQHHVKQNEQVYDFCLYSIVTYFQLIMDANPNMIDTLFVPRRCIVHSTLLAENIRDNRKLFLSKKAWPKFRGYSYSQLSKLNNKTRDNVKRLQSFEKMHDIAPSSYLNIQLESQVRSTDLFSETNTGLGHLSDKEFDEYILLVNSLNKRDIDVMQHGIDNKYMYHLVRLLLEIEQILSEHDLDLERNRDVLKPIRNGEWTLDKLNSWVENKEKSLEILFAKSNLRDAPDEDAIKKLLWESLEQHYGTIEKCDFTYNRNESLINDLKQLVQKYDI